MTPIEPTRSGRRDIPIMLVRILDLDGAVSCQERLSRRVTYSVPLTEWGPHLRLGCGWRDFVRFEAELSDLLGGRRDRQLAVTFIGSGDFHHVSLALLARQPRICNLLVLDNHPDWMRGVPFVHCGTWLYHAAQLPQVHTIFHLGGEVDFDNYYRWLAPWQLLRSGKIRVLPAVRSFRGKAWRQIPHSPVRSVADNPARQGTIEKLLDPWRDELAQLPLYISFDRDVLSSEQSVVNWDSGHLVFSEVLALIKAFRAASAGLAGLDVVGDWSPVRVVGMFRRVLHWTEHPRLSVDPERARMINEDVNLTLLDSLSASEGRWDRFARAA
jgi:hypothetical protein